MNLHDISERLRALANEIDTNAPNQPLGASTPMQGAPDPAALALWLREAPHPEESDEEHAARVAARDAALAEWQRGFNAESHNGLFGVWTLSLEDKVYLATMADAYYYKLRRDIMRDGIVSGMNGHLNAARSEGEYYVNNVSLANYDSPLKREVERRMAGV